MNTPLPASGTENMIAMLCQTKTNYGQWCETTIQQKYVTGYSLVNKFTFFLNFGLDWNTQEGGDYSNILAMKCTLLITISTLAQK